MIAMAVPSVQVFLLPLAQRFLRQAGRGIALVYADWPDGLLPDDSLGELAAYMPVSGSFATYGQTMLKKALASRWAGTTGTTGRDYCR